MCLRCVSPMPIPGRCASGECGSGGPSASKPAKPGRPTKKNRTGFGWWPGIWMGMEGAVIRDLGHSRWKIENNAFGQLTQHWHLTHCAHHHPVAVVALLWIKIIAFTLFHAFAILHGKLFRLGKATLQEVRKQIYRSLLCGSPTQFFSG